MNVHPECRPARSAAGSIAFREFLEDVSKRRLEAEVATSGRETALVGYSQSNVVILWALSPGGISIISKDSHDVPSQRTFSSASHSSPGLLKASLSLIFPPRKKSEAARTTGSVQE